GISELVLLDLHISRRARGRGGQESAADGLRIVWIGNRREALQCRRRQFEQRRSMKPFAVARTHRELLIKRLPANRELRSLGVELRGRLMRYVCARGLILGVPFLALGQIKLQAVSAGEIPGWAGNGNAHFLIHAPNISIYS